MSRLKLYWPDVRGQLDGAVRLSISNDHSTEPAVIPFTRTSRWPDVDSRSGDSQSAAVVERAYTIHANNHCPVCRHPVVEPLELNDAAIGRGNLPIPGTATLVGFRCNSCDTEWPA